MDAIVLTGVLLIGVLILAAMNYLTGRLSPALCIALLPMGAVIGIDAQQYGLTLNGALVWFGFSLLLVVAGLFAEYAFYKRKYSNGQPEDHEPAEQGDKQRLLQHLDG